MNKKGFTLIELLAVIVILAIIALIATPIILSMINNARKSAAKSSTYGYVEAIDGNNGFADAEVEGYTKIEDGTHNVSDITVRMKGKAPDSGTVTITNGKVSSANICINGYTVTYNGHEAETGSKCGGSGSSTYTAYSIGDSINFNPVTGEMCSSPTSTPGTKTGSMKWYVIAASGANSSTVDVILDHNTSAELAYNSEYEYVPYAQASIKTQVESDTTGWTSGLNPRLITADEIAHITGADSEKNWSVATKTSGDGFCFDTNESHDIDYCEKSQGTSSYKWLFNYTYDCTSYGCDIADSSTAGYWTSSGVTDDGYTAWGIDSHGSLHSDDVDNGYGYGIRPVITITKTQS